MGNIFRIPVDNQHFNSTVENGKNLTEVAKYVGDGEKQELKRISKDGVIRYWGSIPGSANERNFNILKSGDEILCYRSGKYIALAKVGLKTSSKELAKHSWGETEKGDTWELIYFFSDVVFFQLETKFIDEEFGFKGGPVMGFNHISDEKAGKFIKKYGSVKDFITGKGYENKIISSAIEDISGGEISSPFEAQFYLVDLGNKLKFDTYVPAIDAGHLVFGKKLDELITIRRADLNQYVAPAILEPLSNIDVIWFKDNYKPRFFYEVIHKSGMNEAFARLKAVSEYYELAKTRIVGGVDRRLEFDRSKRLYFPNPDNISFKFYNELTQLHSESVYYDSLLDKFLG